MCIAVPGKLMEMNYTQGKVNLMGVEILVNIQLIENPKVGDYVLVHGGCAIEKINQDYFDDLEGLFNKIIDGEENYG